MRHFNVWGKIKRFTAITLSAVMMLSVPMSALADNAVKKSNYVISKLNNAQDELAKLARERQINAAIYLKDSYIVKSEANQYSEDVAAIASGQTVAITGVEVDEGRNIWYKISYSYAGGTITGYVEREFIACGDERFVKWEDKYITTTVREEINSISDCSDIQQFPESYRDALYELKKQHPNWVFVRQNVNIDWNTAVYQETLDERSLISSSADSSYKGAPSAKTKGWYNATSGIIAYYMDPRNFLVEDRIFMFEQESFSSVAHTESAVSLVLNGTFMSGGIPDTTMSYAKALVEIGSKANVSSFLLAARLKQEQGVQGTSPLISGTYPGYEGYYNYFNIKANGSTYEAVYTNGLSYAKSQGWNTRYKSIEGGASFVAKNYIARGQDTLYLQKFDVDASDKTLYTHQYMQNISAPYSESKTIYDGYKSTGLLNNSFVFKIPVYDNMLSGKCMKPNATDVLSLDLSEVQNLPVDQNAVLVSLINGGQNNDVAITYTSSDESVAKVDSNGVITGIKPGTATISAKRTENATNTAQCKVSVIKADIALSKVEIPEINVTYAADQRLSTIQLPDKFEWVDSKISPVVDNQGYSVIYSPDSSRYNALTLTIPVNVAKADIDVDEINIPSKLTVDAGEELSTVALPTGFVWVDSTVVAPKKTGKYTFDAYYCVDPANYNAASVKVEVNVVCKSHEFGEWEGDHATCTEDGRLVRKCQICGTSEKLDESAIGHAYTSEITKEATTKEEGVRTYTCTNCGDEYNEVIPKVKDNHVHDYSSKITTAPTCLKDGVMTYSCSCGDSYTESIAASGHDYDEDNKCKNCDYVLPVIPVHIHEFTISGNTATCTEDGVVTYTCGCGDSYEEPSAKLGHDMIDGACKVCGEVEPTPTVGPTPTVEPTKAPSPTVEPTKAPSPTVGPTPTAAPTPTKAAEPVVVVVTEITPPIVIDEQVVTPEPTKAQTPAKTQTPAKAEEPAKAAEETKPAEDPTPTRVAPIIEVVEEPQEIEDQAPIEVVMMSSTVLDKEKIDEFIAPDNQKLRITMANDVVWDIDLEGVDTSNIDINLKVEFGCEIDEKLVESVAQGCETITMELAHDGVFGFPVKLQIPINKDSVGKVANLFYFNPETKALEFMGDAMIDEDGNAAFAMEHASEYVIVIADVSLNPVVAEAENSEDTAIKVSGEEMGVLATVSEKIGFKTGNMIVLYIVLGAVVLLFLMSMTGLIVYKVRQKDDDEFYYDEED